MGPKAQLMISIPSDISRARGQIHGGLSTTWIPSLKPGDLVPVKVGEGCIRPPNDASAPILMCALGTGCFFILSSVTRCTRYGVYACYTSA